MNNKTLGILSFSVLLIFSLGLNFWGLQNQDKTAYVDLQQVFNDFKGKQEIAARFINLENDRKQILDSITLDLQVLENRINQSPHSTELSKEFYRKSAVFTKMKNDFTVQNEQENQMYSDKIWTQINQYTKEFGDENGYDFIYGVSGNGVLMYGKTEKDITDDLVKYINNKYEGL